MEINYIKVEALAGSTLGKLEPLVKQDLIAKNILGTVYYF
jgi:hypothetical protein